MLKMRIIYEEIALDEFSWRHPGVSAMIHQDEVI